MFKGKALGVEEGKGRKSIELGLISHAEELELYLVGSWEPLERFKQVNCMIRFVYWKLSFGSSVHMAERLEDSCHRPGEG